MSRTPTPVQTPSWGKKQPAECSCTTRHHAFSGSTRGHAQRLMLRAILRTGTFTPLYCGRFCIAESTRKNNGFGLFANAPIRKSDVVTTMHRFGHRVRFRTESPIVLSDFDVAANAFLARYWARLAEAWNDWLDDQRYAYRGKTWDVRAVVSKKTPEWARQHFHADAFENPCVASTPPRIDGDMMYQDFYVAYLTVYGYMQRDAKHGNVAWTRHEKATRVVDGEERPVWQLIATKDIARGEEVLLGTSCVTDSVLSAAQGTALCAAKSRALPPPPMYFTPPKRALPPLAESLGI